MFWCVSYGTKETYVKYDPDADTFMAVCNALRNLLWKPRPHVKVSQSPGFKARRAPVKGFFT